MAANWLDTLEIGYTDLLSNVLQPTAPEHCREILHFYRSGGCAKALEKGAAEAKRNILRRGLGQALAPLLAHDEMHNRISPPLLSCAVAELFEGWGRAFEILSSDLGNRENSIRHFQNAPKAPHSLLVDLVRHHRHRLHHRRLGLLLELLSRLSYLCLF